MWICFQEERIIWSKYRIKCLANLNNHFSWVKGLLEFENGTLISVPKWCKKKWKNNVSVNTLNGHKKSMIIMPNY